MLKLDIVTNIVSTLIECTIYTAILNAYWKYESKYRYVVSTLGSSTFFLLLDFSFLTVRCFRWHWALP